MPEVAVESVHLATRGCFFNDDSGALLDSDDDNSVHGGHRSVLSHLLEREADTTFLPHSDQRDGVEAWLILRGCTPASFNVASTNPDVPPDSDADKIIINNGEGPVEPVFGDTAVGGLGDVSVVPDPVVGGVPIAQDEVITSSMPTRCSTLVPTPTPVAKIVDGAHPQRQAPPIISAAARKAPDDLELGLLDYYGAGRWHLLTSRAVTLSYHVPKLLLGSNSPEAKALLEATLMEATRERKKHITGTSLNKDKLEGENSKNVYGRHSFNFSYNVYDHIQQRRKEFGDGRTNIIKANAMAALHNQSCCSATSGMSRSAKDRAFGLLGDGEELGRRKATTFQESSRNLFM
jgi:hypothetical protein